jgi:hypothetical protein
MEWLTAVNICEIMGECFNRNDLSIFIQQDQFIMTPLAILLLYLAFRAKQFICDFVLQTDWMAMNKGKPGLEGVRPLLLHAGVHGIGTLLIALVFAPSLWWLGLADVVIHALVDRLKGILSYQKGWKPTDRWFWWSFGLDQEAHNLTHVGYMLIILAQTGLVFG